MVAQLSAAKVGALFAQQSSFCDNILFLTLDHELKQELLSKWRNLLPGGSICSNDYICSNDFTGRHFEHDKCVSKLCEQTVTGILS